MLELFSDLYTLYPFHQEKYGHCLTELSGGMEHQTMTTIGHFGFGIVAHELAHMWFGDNVTCATWSDIWVNEGFATYSDYLAHENLAASQYPPIWLKNAHDYIISEPGGSVYVPPDEVYYGNEMRIFSGRLSYYKGAYLLHMIRYELGDDELFFEVMRNFQETYADSVATSQDFINVLNQTTEMDFTGFFDQWFFGEGYPVYNLDWSYAGGEFEIVSSQSASASDVTPFFAMIYPVRIYLSDGSDTTIQIEQVQPLVAKTVSLEAGVDSIQVDPDHWVLKRVDNINGVLEPRPGNSINVSPNPAHDLLFLSTHKAQFSQGSIYDLYGKAVLSFETDKSDLSLDVSLLESGLYLIRLVTDGRTSVHKFVKH
jgi:aminopeptidase N